MYDVVVVGGGPAGLATAIVARRAGLAVVVLERSRPPLDKACGEGLMPGGVAALKDLGVQVDSLSSRAFRGIRYIDVETGVVAEGVFQQGSGMGVRRRALHAALVQRASQVGADLRWGARVTGLDGGAARIGDDRLAARWIVGADGLHSMVRRWAGLDAGSRGGRFGARRHFAVEPWTDFVEVHWGRGAEAYVTPVGECEVGVALLTRETPPIFDAMLARFPALARRLAGRRPTSDARGAGPFHQRTRGVHRGTVALVGDAAGYLDPINGEGLGLAFREASALVDAMTRGDLGRYARAHRRIVFGYQRLTSLLLVLQRHPALRRRAIVALRRRPEVFARILAAHGGLAPVRAIGVGGAARLVGAALRG